MGDTVTKKRGRGRPRRLDKVIWTYVALSPEIRKRLEAEAALQRRPFGNEGAVLIEEALHAREARRKKQADREAAS